MNKKIRKIKKQAKIRKVERIDPETGEIEVTTIIEKIVDQDFGFHKVWIMDIMHVLDFIGNKKIKVLEYLIERMDSKNIVISTIRKIAKDLNISIKTVSITINKLIEKDLIRKVNKGGGVYMINPDIIAKVDTRKRKTLVIKYMTETADRIKFPSERSERAENE